MELLYHHAPRGNFGDDLNPWLWDRLLPGWRGWTSGRVLVGVGTLLNATLTDRDGDPPRRYLVAGAGVGYGGEALPDMTDADRWDIRALRGPHSARRLGLPNALGLLDPAAMASDFPEFHSITTGSHPLFIPHEASVDRHDWAAACAEAGIAYASPRWPPIRVIAAIAGAGSVLAESLHAAILADAFRVPWRPVRIGWQIYEPKWRDWAAALEIPLAALPPLFAGLERVNDAVRPTVRLLRACRAEGGAPVSPGRPAAHPLRLALERSLLAPALARRLRDRAYLSDPAICVRQRDRYAEVLETIRRDYGAA